MDIFCIGWITFAITAVMQGCLLIMCCVWKIRQDKLGVDDFGNPVDPLIYPTIGTDDSDEVHRHPEILIAPDDSTTEGEMSPPRSQYGDETPPSLRKVEPPTS